MFRLFKLFCIKVQNKSEKSSNFCTCESTGSHRYLQSLYLRFWLCSVLKMTKKPQVAKENRLTVLSLVKKRIWHSQFYIYQERNKCRWVSDIFLNNILIFIFTFGLIETDQLTRKFHTFSLTSKVCSGHTRDAWKCPKVWNLQATNWSKNSCRICSVQKKSEYVRHSRNQSTQKQPAETKYDVIYRNPLANLPNYKIINYNLHILSSRNESRELSKNSCMRKFNILAKT